MDAGQFNWGVRYRSVIERIPTTSRFGRWLRVVIDRELRVRLRLEREQRGILFQPATYTCEDRYPELYQALADRLCAIPNPRILCFGCSDGSEVRTLRRVIPGATIRGIDINPLAIARARRSLARNPDPKISYAEAGDTAAEPAGHYDAVVAVSVLRNEILEFFAPGRCDAVLPYSRFAAAVDMLDRVLRPGGWLALWNTHHRFCDTDCGARYRAETLAFAAQDPVAVVYGPDNQRLDGTYSEILFRKPAEDATTLEVAFGGWTDARDRRFADGRSEAGFAPGAPTLTGSSCPEGDRAAPR